MGESHHAYVSRPLRGIVFCMHCREWKCAADVDRVDEEAADCKKDHAHFDCLKCGHRQTSIVFG